VTLGKTVTNENCIYEEMRCRLNLGNASYLSVQNLLSYCLLSNKVKFKIYKTIILPVILYGCEILSVTLRGVHILRVSENWG
jgi:hypothetical protein